MHCEQMVDCRYSQVERVLRKYIFVGKPILHFVYHFYLKRTVFERTKFFNGQNFIKKSARFAGTFSSCWLIVPNVVLSLMEPILNK